MAMVMINEQHLIDIGNAIRDINEEAETYKPREMADAIRFLAAEGGGNVVASYPKITSVMSYTAEDFTYVDPSYNIEVSYNMGTVSRYTLDTSIYDKAVKLRFKVNFIKSALQTESYSGAYIVAKFNSTVNESKISSNTIVDKGIPFPMLEPESYKVILGYTSMTPGQYTCTLDIPASANRVDIETYIHDLTVNPDNGEMSFGEGRSDGRIDLSDFTIV